MKPRYIVVNDIERTEFEKKYQMPYGYNGCPYICGSYDEAIKWFNFNLGLIERKKYVIEEYNSGNRRII
uniref:Uncharacterized protein n=1 Tax=viral metagenome TaxID=1070528 RepID=A0A6M3JUV7_9ZZZZ